MKEPEHRTGSIQIQTIIKSIALSMIDLPLNFDGFNPKGPRCSKKDRKKRELSQQLSPLLQHYIHYVDVPWC